MSYVGQPHPCTPSPPPITPHSSSAFQLFSAPLYWMSFPLPSPSTPLYSTHSLHPLTQTLTFLFPTFSFPVQNDRKVSNHIKICVSVSEGREDYSSYQRHFCTWCYTGLHLPFLSLVQNGGIHMTHKMCKGEMRTFTICSPVSYLSASSPSHSTKLTLYITLSPWA